MKIEMVSVSGGKFHVPANPEFNGGGKDITNARQMLCGLDLVPQNFYQTAADANAHTGGRLHLHFCKRCAKAQAVAASTN